MSPYWIGYKVDIRINFFSQDLGFGEFCCHGKGGDLKSSLCCDKDPNANEAPNPANSTAVNGNYSTREAARFAVPGLIDAVIGVILKLFKV